MGPDLIFRRRQATGGHATRQLVSVSAIIFLMVMVTTVVIKRRERHLALLGQTRIQVTVAVRDPGGDTVPQTVEISWNGKKIANGDKIEPGTGQLTLSTSNAAPVTQHMTVKLGEALKTAPIELRLLSGSAEFQTDPVGATVLLQGREVGKTPLTVSNIVIGEYTARLRVSGYPDHDAKFHVTKDKTAVVRYRVPRSRLQLSSPVKGVTVKDSASGKILGKTPLDISIAPGVYTLECRGHPYPASTNLVILKDGEAETLELKLPHLKHGSDAWVRRSGQWPAASISSVIVDGILIIHARDGGLVGLDVATGETRWRLLDLDLKDYFWLPGSARLRYVQLAANGGGRIILWNADRRGAGLIMVQARDGSLIRAGLPDHPNLTSIELSACSIDENDNLYLLGSDKRSVAFGSGAPGSPAMKTTLFSLNGDGTVVRWLKGLVVDVGDKLSIGSKHGYFTSSQGIWKFNLDNGVFDSQFSARALTVAAARTVVMSKTRGGEVALGPNNVLAVNTESALVWYSAEHGSLLRKAEQKPMSNTVIGSDGTTYSLLASRLNAITSRGLSKWVLRLPSATGTSHLALAADNVIYVGMGKELQAISILTGKPIFSRSMGGYIGALKVGPLGVLYVTTHDGVVHAVAGKSPSPPPDKGWPMFRANPLSNGAGRPLKG